jgi:putative ABC transport system permease protein
MALGASQREVLTVVLTDGVRLAAFGIAAGAGVSLGAMRLLASQLYGVKATDPWTFGAVAVILAMVSALAAYVRRSARKGWIQWWS